MTPNGYIQEPIKKKTAANKHQTIDVEATSYNL